MRRPRVAARGGSEHEIVRLKRRDVGADHEVGCAVTVHVRFHETVGRAQLAGRAGECGGTHERERLVAARCGVGVDRREVDAIAGGEV